MKRSELGLTETQAETPINVNGEMWTLKAAAEFLYEQRRTENPDREKIAAIRDELARLREDALEIGDRQLIGAADALHESATTI